MIWNAVTVFTFTTHLIFYLIITCFYFATFKFVSSPCMCLFQERYTVTRLCLHPKLNQFIAQTQGSYAAIFSTERPYKMNKNTRFEGHKVRNQHAVWRNTLKPYTLKVLFSRWMSLFMVLGCSLWIEWNIYLQLPFIKILHRTLNSKAWLFISWGNKVCL